MTRIKIKNMIRIKNVVFSKPLSGIPSPDYSGDSLQSSQYVCTKRFTRIGTKTGCEYQPPRDSVRFSRL
ncbi:hypothetical protein Pla52n_63700 [Stieleria varia]|uniref:Uncharacterized protein n=1 Tax=Stieleria varia TaxID=2528005 RepID=A0A5C6A0K8_9BACT|nr:hypothetical protein Pla52n_63700 [Stieleria varia]